MMFRWDVYMCRLSVSVIVLFFTHIISRFFFFFSSRRRHTRCGRDWSSDVCSSDLKLVGGMTSAVDSFNQAVKVFGQAVSFYTGGARAGRTGAESNTAFMVGENGPEMLDRKSVV